jgi:phenylacetic acid degradation operon negative regulatory protein
MQTPSRPEPPLGEEFELAASSGDSRRFALGYANGARSALMTVVSRFVYADPVPVPTQAFVTALELLGFNEKATRQALNRARDAGWLESQKVGRRSLWVLSPQGHELMDEGSSRIRALRGPKPAWDRRVLFVNVLVPENDRQTRHILRTRMSWLGFATVASGLWVTTNLSAEVPARKLCAELRLDAYSFTGVGGAIGSLDDVVREAWDIDRLADEYRSFIDEFSPLRPSTPEEYFVYLARLVHRWRRFPFIDPNLPDELLPSPWIGARAGALAYTLSELWNQVAQDWWKELLRRSAEGA